MPRDPASDQLNNYKKTTKGDPPILLTGNGVPIANKTASLTVGPRGPLLLQDFQQLEEMAHFNRERIPERLVHAKGAGAFGYFEVTHDITGYTRAKVFSKIGKRTSAFARFSQAIGEKGSADLVRDLRGMAMKFYTEEGTWDQVTVNTAANFLNDPILFTSLMHSQKRNPVTNLRDPNMVWDFFSLRPESTHSLMMIYGDRGIPDGYRHMDGFPGHAFKLVNHKNEIVYAKFNWKTNQRIKNFSQLEAIKISEKEPNYSTRDLYNAIARGEYPSWTLYIQIMTPQQTLTTPFNPFDLTKVWPHKEFPMIPVGKLVLNKNPENYFKDVEQAAFNPAHLPPGIEPSPADKVLHGRIFAYRNSQNNRVGTNHLQLPINCPYKTMSAVNYQRDGFMALNNQGGAPKYLPNSFNGPIESPGSKSPGFHVSGEVDRHDGPISQNDFDQATAFWRKVLKEDEKTRMVEAIAGDVKNAYVFIVERVVENFRKVDDEMGSRLIDELRKSGVSINAKSAHL